MVTTTVTVSLCQCGNQGMHLDTTFSPVLCERGILEDWVTKGGERKHVFFYQAEDGHYIPRAALIDLEPRVINTILSGPHEGGGAGNGWAQGYAAGERIYDEVMDMLHRFMLMHSIADGTGSGLGSYVLNGSTIVPKEADAAYSPCNSLLTLKCLTKHTHSLAVFGNNVLARISTEKLYTYRRQALITVFHQVATVMAASTQTLRYPGPMYNDLLSLIALLISSSRCRFLLASYTSFTGDQIDQANPVRKATVLNVMRRLLQPTNRILSMTPSKTACYISTLNIIQVYQSLLRIRPLRCESVLLEVMVLVPNPSRISPLESLPRIGGGIATQGMRMPAATTFDVIEIGVYIALRMRTRILT
ncbi:Tubulin/FtsZ, GTPase domain-containing protein [Gautieria morchelliformis]|nr:Tubulin/FtsZ, GTPase domain-containing protein [Gautieria morchelliformis]